MISILHMMEAETASHKLENHFERVKMISSAIESVNHSREYFINGKRTTINRFFESEKKYLNTVKEPAIHAKKFIQIIDRYFTHKSSMKNIEYKVYYDEGILYDSMASEEKKIEYMKSNYIYLVLEGINNWIDLKVKFDLYQFSQMVDTEGKSDIANKMIASLLLLIKNHINMAEFSSDIYGDVKKSVFTATNQLEINIMAHALSPSLHFVLTLQYEKGSMSQMTDMKYIYNYIKCRDLIVDISIDNGGGLFVFYDHKEDKSTIMPIHMIRDEVNNVSGYLASFNHLIIGSEDSKKKNYRGDYIANYFRDYGDSGRSGYITTEMSRSSCVIDISKSFFAYPFYIYRSNSKDHVCIDIYNLALNSLDIRKKNNIYERYNDIANIQCDRSPLEYHVNVSKPLKNEKISDSRTFRTIAQFDPKSQYNGKKVDRFTEKNLYDNLLHNVNAFAVSVIRRSNSKLQEKNTLFKLINRAGIEHIVARFDVNGNVIISDYSCMKDMDKKNFFLMPGFLEKIVSRDKKWVELIEKYRNSKSNMQMGENSNINKHEVSFSELSEKERKYLGLVDFFDGFSDVVAISVERRIFMRFGSDIYAYMQDPNFHLVSLFKYTFLMYFNEKSKNFISLSLDELVLKFVFDKFDYEKVGFLLRCWNKPSKDISTIVPEFAHTFFLKFALGNGRFYIHDFNEIFNLSLSFVEMFIDKNYEGVITKKLLTSVVPNRGAYFNTYVNSKDANYDDILKTFGDNYVEKIFADLAYKISQRAGISVNLSNVKYSSEHVKNFVSGLSVFVKEILSGFTDKQNAKDLETVESMRVVPYAAIEKAFAALSEAFGHLCMDSNGNLNTILRDAMFQEMKSYLFNAVIIYYFTIAKEEKKNVNMHIDKEALLVIYKEVKLTLMIFSPTVGRGFHVANIKLPHTEVTEDKEARGKYFTVPKGALNSASSFVEWMQKILDTSADDVRIMNLYSKDLEKLEIVKEFNTNAYSNRLPQMARDMATNMLKK